LGEVGDLLLLQSSFIGYGLTQCRYHDENTKEEDLIHPEDIEHFRKHDELEDEADRVAALDKLSIVEQNIPAKFRKE